MAYGYNAQTGEYGDLVKLGIIDPTKVVRTALQDAASVAGLLITTEAIITEQPKKESAPRAGRRHGRHGRHGLLKSRICAKRHLKAPVFRGFLFTALTHFGLRGREIIFLSRCESLAKTASQSVCRSTRGLRIHQPEQEGVKWVSCR